MNKKQWYEALFENYAHKYDIGLPLFERWDEPEIYP